MEQTPKKHISKQETHSFLCHLPFDHLDLLSLVAPKAGWDLGRPRLLGRALGAIGLPVVWFRKVVWIVLVWVLFKKKKYDLHENLINSTSLSLLVCSCFVFIVVFRGL